MTQQKLIASIEQYQPYNVQEEMDKSLILEWIKNNNICNVHTKSSIRRLTKIGLS